MAGLCDRFGRVDLCKSVDDRCVVNTFLSSLALTDITERLHVFFDGCVFLDLTDIGGSLFKVVADEFTAQVLLGFHIARAHESEREIVKEFIGHLALLLCLKIRVDSIAVTAFLKVFVAALFVRTLTACHRKSDSSSHSSNENLLHFVSFR